jgi:hypothetical protein
MQNTARMRLANLSLDGNDQPVLFKHEPKVMAKKLFVELSSSEQETLSGGYDSTRTGKPPSKTPS